MAKILIVEDDELFVLALTTILESNGHSVTSAGNGKQAIAELQKGTFDCILSDLQMPVMTGFELIKWVRANLNTPFIMMTGFAQNIDPQRALEHGATCLLYKPFSDVEILQALASCTQPAAGKAG